MNVMRGAGGAGGNRGDDERRRRALIRHTVDQTARLEEFFLLNPHPDDRQKRAIAQEIGLEPRQIKFWFQNKRTQLKAQNERDNNHALRAENERMKKENERIWQLVKNMLCEQCGGSALVFVGAQQAQTLQLLMFENNRLRHEHEKVRNLLSQHSENPLSSFPGTELSLAPPSSDLGVLVSLTLGLGGSDEIPASVTTTGVDRVVNALKAEMYQAVNQVAREELLRLLQTDSPYWVMSPPDRRTQVLHPLTYQNTFARANHFQSPTARVESSKDCRIVKLPPMQLVEIMLDADQWINIFSTLVSKAVTLNVLYPGVEDTRNGTLQLMYEELHVFSPLVPPREFFFLRYCQKVEPNQWVIGDVSFDFKKEDAGNSRAWKHPSGCLIEGLPNGSSRVIWVEHVEVDEGSNVPILYRDILTSGMAFGAQRWLSELDRMSDRLAYASSESITRFDFGGVMTLPKGRRNLMMLTQRMVKNFCGALNMSTNQAITTDEEEIRIAVRRSIDRCNPIGSIVVAAISLWVPLPCHQLFDFFKDVNSRAEWDSLIAQEQVQEIAHISTGAHPGNYVSVIRSVNPDSGGNSVLIIQESFTHCFGSYIVFSPISLEDFSKGVREEEAGMMVQLLPSGITITEDGGAGQHHHAINAVDGAASSGSRTGARPKGSLVTICYQLLLHNVDKNQQPVSMEINAAATALIKTTVQRLGDALKCPIVERG